MFEEETRVFADGSQITRSNAEMMGLSWSVVRMYTEPLEEER